MSCWLLLLLASSAFPAMAAPHPTISCTIEFSSDGWSAVYQRAEGFGTVFCSDGETAVARIELRGAGITAGKWRVHSGKGRFFNVHAMKEVFGTYLSIRGDVGLFKYVHAGAATKGKVSVVLAGRGDGFDIGVSINQMQILDSFEAPSPPPVRRTP